MVAFLIDNDQSGFITGSDMIVDGGCITAGGFFNRNLKNLFVYPWEN